MEYDSTFVEPRSQTRQRFFDPLCHLNRIGAVLPRNHQDHAGLAHDCRTADRRLRRIDHIGYIAEQHARSALVEQDGTGHIFCLDRLTLGLEDDALIGCVDEARAAHAGRLSRRSQHVVEGQIVANELIRMDLHLQRSNIAAEHGDLGDARHGEEPQTQRPVGDGAQIHERALVGGQPGDEDGAR